jgi:hypothetical protein
MSHLLTLEKISDGSVVIGFGLFSTPIENHYHRRLDYYAKILFLNGHYLINDGSCPKYIVHDREYALSLAYYLVKSKVDRYKHLGDKFENRTSLGS